MKKLALLHVFLIALMVMTINSCKTELVHRNTDICLNSIGLGISFPPIKDETQRNFSKEQFDKLGVTKIRFAENCVLREPTQGNFNWQPLDDRINWVNENNYELLLTIQSDIPSWSENKQADFTNYIQLLLQRYSNKISKIQFGNEWDTQYEDSMDEFVSLNNILWDLTKEISPNTKVVLGGITRAVPIIEIYCENGLTLDFSDMEFSNGLSVEKLFDKINQNLCGSDIKQNVLYVLQNAKYDILDIHLYDDVSNWNDYVNVISEIIPDSIQIIVSEFGGPSSEFENIDQQYQAKRLEKYLNVISNLNIDEAYFFKLVDSEDAYHKNSGLFDKNVNKKLTYDVFYKFVKN